MCIAKKLIQLISATAGAIVEVALRKAVICHIDLLSVPAGRNDDYLVGGEGNPAVLKNALYSARTPLMFISVT